ncbi:redoxin domain-containing protein [Dyella terrae]|uniref:redoxin domain-containing protein n=1 Tax=Dyella terrae TaxID=522259 RepID=UPI001EFDD525|nr:redoxin domain-containing protein [Dyella terrae]
MFARRCCSGWRHAPDAPRLRRHQPGRHRSGLHHPGQSRRQELHPLAGRRAQEGAGHRVLLPSAYTGGCDIEAHAFATEAAKFAAAGATIIGVSADSIDRLNTFSADPSYCAGKFPVASDPQGKIAAQYDVKMSAAEPDAKDVQGQAIEHGFISRVTFVIGRDGKVAAVFSSEADHLHPQDHVSKSLAIVQQLQATKAP